MLPATGPANWIVEGVRFRIQKCCILVFMKRAMLHSSGLTVLQDLRVLLVYQINSVDPRLLVYNSAWASLYLVIVAALLARILVACVVDEGLHIRIVPQLLHIYNS